MYINSKPSWRGILTGALIAACWLHPDRILAQTDSGTPASLERNERDNTPASIVFPADVRHTLAEAQDLLKQYLRLGASDEMRFVKTDDAGSGVTVQRFNQYYNGIKVEHGAYTITAKDDRISFMSGDFYSATNPLTTQPALDESAALQKALEFTGAEKYMWQDAGGLALMQRLNKNMDASGIPRGTLVFVEDFNGEQPDGKLHLAYRFDIYAMQPLSRKNVYVDATTGRILLADAILKHVTGTGNSLYSGNISFETQLSGGSYRLHDLTRGNGVITMSMNNSTTANPIEITNATTTWPTSAALDAQWAGEKVYDYWKFQRGRLSYDGLDAELDNFVHYGSNYNNAFWDGTAMYYGDGSGIANGGFTPLTSLDVTAHEIGHGVCEYTANLVYNREPGAMNEGLSDIWGAVIEHYADPHEVDAKAKSTWEMGEEIGSTPLRSMANPKLYGDPDTYGGINWVNASASCTPNGGNDQCGVHTNSGVLNHWFYLLSVGGSGTNDLNNAFQVAGINIDTAAHIVYNTELVLTANSNYAAFRTASINVANTLYGICSPQSEAVTRAWYAVGVGPNFTPCTPQVGFASASTTVSEYVDTLVCPAGKTISIPVVITGPPVTGGTPSITVSIAGGTAVNGVDYTLNTVSLSFPPGITTQNVIMTIFDNGSVDTDKYVDLSFSLSANGSNATMSNIVGQTRVIIQNDDQLPIPGGEESHTVDTSNVTSNFTSPFYSSARAARTQYIIPVQNLVASGLRANTPITSMAVNVTQKNSTAPFTGYTVKMGATTAVNFNASFITTTWTQVYNGNYTTALGWDTITFSTPYVWNGTSNIVIEICFTNPANSPGNDRVEGFTSALVTAYNSSNSTTAVGCNLNFNNNNISTARPVIRFVQSVAPTPVETTAVSTRRWDIHSGQNVYFYSEADSELMAAMLNMTADLGCVEAQVIHQGSGFSPASFASVNRSLKEFTMVPTLNVPAVTYDAILYFTNTELGSVNLPNVRMIKTTAATDAAISPSNTQVVVPTLISGQSWTGFKGSFTGLSRYFLVDGNPKLVVPSVSGGAGQIWVNNNPFRNSIDISYSMKKDEAAHIRLYDVTGRLVYSEERTLQSGQHQFSVQAGKSALTPGYYMLQIIRPESVFTQKLLKD